MNKKIVFVGAFLASCTFIIILSVRSPAPFLLVRSSGQSFAAHIYSASRSTSDFFTGLGDSIGRTRALQQENRKLRQQLQTQRLMSALYEHQLEEANRLLSAELGSASISDYAIVSTRVLAYSPEDFFKTLLLDKGYQHQLRAGMAVINTQGLVGKIIEIYPHSAKVLLITDERMKLGVRIERTQDLGVLSGTGSPRSCRLDYVLTSSAVLEGDKVVSSGLGGTLPAGLTVGTVTRVQSRPNYVFQQIQVQPAVDFGRLNRLFVLEEGE